MFDQTQNGRETSEKTPSGTAPLNGSVAEPIHGSMAGACQNEVPQLRPESDGKDGLAVEPVVDIPTNGSVAEPNVLPAESPLASSDSNGDHKLGFVAGLSSPFEVELGDLQWSADMQNDYDALQSLGASLKVLQINDIIISPKSTTGKHMVIAGNRRCAGAALAGLTHLRVRIYQGKASEIVSVVENAQRVDESPKSLLRRLRNALQGGVDREEVREFLGATGKAKSTISDLLFGARLDEDRYQAVMCSENVFRAIADLRKRKRVSDAPPPVGPAPQVTASDDGRKPQENGAVEHQSVAESAPSVNNVAAQPLEESPASDQHVEPATQSETDVTEMLPSRNGSVAERPAKQSETDVTGMLPARNGSVAERPADPVTASRWASWRKSNRGSRNQNAKPRPPQMLCSIRSPNRKRGSSWTTICAWHWQNVPRPMRKKPPPGIGGWQWFDRADRATFPWIGA